MNIHISRRSRWLLVPLAMLALCGQLHAQTNSPATGEPAVTYASGITAPTEDSAITAAQGTIMDADGITTFTPDWAWHEGDAADGDFMPIASATAATFTPLQIHVGKFLRVCATFDDDASNEETRCWTASAAVANVNDAAVAKPNTIFVPVGGTHTFSTDDFPFTDEDDDNLTSVRFLTAPAKGTITNTAISGILQSDGTFEFTVVGTTRRINADVFTSGLASAGIQYAPPADATTAMAGYTTFTWRANDAGTAATITIDLVASTASAATGAPTVDATDSMATAWNEDVELTASVTGVTDANGIVTHTRNWQWQSATTQTGTYTAIAGATEETFTPLQAHIGQFIRVCLSFTDGIGTSEGPLCSAPAAGNAIAAVNDAPTSADSSVDVLTTATAADPYRFKVSDFPFMDEESTDPISIIIVGLDGIPNDATLVGGSGVGTADGLVIQRANISNYRFSPAPGTDATDGYASFTFRVSDGNSFSDIHTMTINVISPTQMAATGAPAVAATDSMATAWNEDVTLTAAIGTVADANGINQSTLEWQWQQAAAMDGAYADIAGAAAATFTPMQAQVGMFVRVCASFMDNFTTPGDETRCTAGNVIARVNSAVNVPITASESEPYTFKPSDFMFPEDTGTLTSIRIVTTIASGKGVFRGGPLPIENGDSVQATGIQRLIYYPPANSEVTPNFASFTYTVNYGGTNTATRKMNINLVPPGKDIPEQQAVQVAAILAAPAMANAVDAIMGGMSAGPNDLSLDGTSLAGAARTLRQSAAAEQNPWHHSTTAEWEYHAAHNATDNSAESLRHRLQSMAAGDIAMNWQAGGSAMRFWARYQSLDLSGNEGETLEYDGSGTGFYLGADRRINDKMRLGLAISTDSADLSLRLDDDTMDDEATRSATTIYPYMQMDLGNNNQLRVIAGIGSGDLDIKSTANSDETASAGLSWNMLAASIRHHRPMRGNLSARFDGSFQLGNSSTDAATFANGSTLAAADASTNQIAIDAQLRYQSGNFTPHASITARKQGGDLSQSLAMDLGLGADLQTGPAILRLSITRQLNDTTHKRDTLSLDIATTPNPSGLSASLGSRYDSLSGRPQWQSTVRWQRRTHELSLAASQSDYRLQARLRW